MSTFKAVYLFSESQEDVVFSNSHDLSEASKAQIEYLISKNSRFFNNAKYEDFVSWISAYIKFVHFFKSEDAALEIFDRVCYNNLLFYDKKNIVDKKIMEDFFKLNVENIIREIEMKKMFEKMEKNQKNKKNKENMIADKKEQIIDNMEESYLKDFIVRY